MASGGSRPGAGRKRKDPALNLTPAARAAVPSSPDAPLPIIPPLHLSDLAQLLFADIVATLAQQGRAEPQFAQTIALLAQRLEQIQRWQAVLEMSGDTCTSTTVRKVDGQQVVTAMRQTQSLLGELMLSPSTAMKLASGKKDAPGDFDDF